MAKIKEVKALEIIDSRGNPTVEVEVTLDSGASGRAAVPSGASTGEHEAVELRDGDKKRFLGKGVLKAVNNVNTAIAPKIKNMDPNDQRAIDKIMIELDGTPNKGKLGANAILGASLAVCKAASAEKKTPLFKHIREVFGITYKDFILPVPMMNILNGGQHADNNVDLQEFMIMPIGAAKFSEGIRMGAEVFHNLKKVLNKKGYNTAIGDEGGFAPNLNSNKEALEVIAEAVAQAGYKLGDDIVIALDPASSEFYKDGKYVLEGEKEDKEKTSSEMIEYYLGLAKTYPIRSIEDGLAEDDWAGWKEFTTKAGKKMQLVGDDLFVTNTKRLAQGIEKGVGNSILIKVNQIGSLSETIDAILMAYKANYTAVMSHRSGETEDTFIADLAVAMNTGQIKTGSASRTDRICKYNQLLRIEQLLGSQAQYLGKNLFKKFQ